MTPVTLLQRNFAYTIPRATKAATAAHHQQKASLDAVKASFNAVNSAAQQAKPINARTMHIGGSATAVGHHVIRNGSNGVRKLAHLARQQMRQGSSTRKLIDALGGDVGNIVLALDELMNQSNQEGGQQGDQEARIKAECQRHLDEIKKQGMDQANAANESQWSATHKELHNLYQQQLIKNASPLAVLQGLMATIAMEAVSAGLGSLQGMLSRQLATRQPGNLRAKPQQQIEMIMLNTAIRLAGALKNCASMLSSANVSHPTPVSFLHQILESVTKGQGLTPAQVEKMHAPLAEGKNQRQQSSTFNQLINLVLRLPLVFWKEEKKRQGDIKMLREMMDARMKGVERNKLGQPTKDQLEKMAEDVSETLQKSMDDAKNAIEHFK